MPFSPSFTQAAAEPGGSDQIGVAASDSTADTDAASQATGAPAVSPASAIKAVRTRPPTAPDTREEGDDESWPFTRRKVFLLAGVALMLLAVVVVLAAVCGSGRCASSVPGG